MLLRVLCRHFQFTFTGIPSRDLDVALFGQVTQRDEIIRSRPGPSLDMNSPDKFRRSSW